MKKYLLVFVGFWVGLAYAAPWPMFHRDAKHTGKTSVVAAQKDSLKWTFDLGVEVSPSGGPSIGNPDGVERIFLGVEDGVRIIDTDGIQVGYIACSSSVKTVVAIKDTVVYFGAGDSLFAYFVNEQKYWSYLVDGNISHVTIFEDRIYVCAGDRLWCFGLDGDSLWSTDPLGGGIDKASPTVDDSGNIYIATLRNPVAWYDFRVYAFNPNGSEKWVYQALAFEPGGVRVSPTIGPEGQIFVATRYCSMWLSGFYSIKDGSRLWRKDANVKYSSPAVDKNRVFYGTLEGLTARETDGNFSWHYGTASAITWSAPAVGGDGTVYVGTDGGMFLAIGQDGNLKWSHDTQEENLSSAAIGSDGMVYVSSESGKLFAFAKSDVGVEEKERNLSVSRIQSNPFRCQAVINYHLPVSGRVNLSIYNLSGAKIRELVSGQQEKGSYQIYWDGRDGYGRQVPSGTYFLRLKTENTSSTEKLIVIR